MNFDPPQMGHGLDNREEFHDSSLPSISKASASSPPKTARRARLYDLVFGVGLVALFAYALHRPFHLHEFGVWGIATLLLLLVSSLPLVDSNYRPFTFTGPTAFGLAIWISPGVAAASALASHFLRARFWVKGGAYRGYTRFQGGQLTLASLAIATFWNRLPVRFTPNDLSHVLSVGLLAAFIFVGLELALSLLAPPPRVKRVEMRRNLAMNTLVYSVGLLPILLLIPLRLTYGPILCLPVGLLLLLAATTLRLSHEVNGLHRQLQIAEALGRAGLKAAGSERPEQLLERFLKLAQELLQCERSLVWLPEAGTGDFYPAVALPDKGPFAGRKYHFGHGLVGHAAARVRPRLILDAATDVHRAHYEMATGSWILYPIVVREQILGVAHWVRPASNPFLLEDLERLEALMPLATIALENFFVHEQIRVQAITDGLTGLWNQRHTMELLREELQRAARYHRTFSILMLDVDSFKSFNDTYGHLRGDQLLRSIATVLRTSVRSVDHVGRYGGEEFLVILPETGKHEACLLAERLRAAVEEYGVILTDKGPVRRTVSIGVAAYPEDALNPAELIERADEALYRAKRAGKNCVIWA